MPAITPDLLRLSAAGVRTIYQDAYDRFVRDAEWMQIATVVPTTLATQAYAWLGDIPQMDLFKDRTKENILTSAGYSITDQIYDATQKIYRRELEDDQTGLIRTRIENLAWADTRHWNKLTFDTLEAGFTTVGYDGQYFFDTDHSEGASGTQSNKTSNPLTAANLSAARASMRLVLSDRGEPLDIVPNVLVVGPLLEDRAREIVGSDVVVIRVGDGTASTGATAATNYMNVHQGRTILIVSNRIRGYHWFLLDASGPLKPIIIQERSDIPTSIETDMDEDSAKIREEYLVRVRARRGAGYGLWQTAYGSDASS